MRPALVPILLGSVNPTLSLDFVSGRYQLGNGSFSSPGDIPGWSFTRASVGTAQDSGGNVIAFASGVPRVTDLGLLVEEGRTNLVTWSQAFTNVAWSAASGATIADNTTVAPDGTTTAGTLTFNTTNSNRIEQTTATAAVNGTTYTGAIWLKGDGVGTLRVTINTSTGVGGNQETVITPPTTWTRYTQTFTASSPTGNVRLMVIWRTGDTATSVKLWGGQVETGSVATSYIVTTSAAATRAADVPLITGLAISLKQGGMRTTWKQSAQKAQVSGLIAVDGGDGVNNRVQSFLDSSGKVGWRYSAGGADQIGADGSATVGAGLHKAGVAWSSAGFFGYVDGAQDITGALTPSSTTLDTANAGVTISAHAALNDYLQSFSIYAAPPSIAQLQALTQ